MKQYLILPFLPVLLVMQCSTIKSFFQRPSVSIESVQIERMDLAGSTLKITVIVNNPNAIGLTVNHFEYRFEVNGEKLLEGTRAEAVTIDPDGKTEVTLIVDLKYKGLRGGIAGILTEKKLPYKFTGLVVVDTPVSPLDFDLDFAGDIPIPDPPRFSLDKITFDKIGLTESTVTFYVRVSHNKDLKLNVAKFEYRVIINKKDVSAYAGQADRVKQADGFVLPVAVNLRLRALGAALLRSIKNRSFSYDFMLSMHVDSDYGPYKLDFKKSGSI